MMRRFLNLVVESLDTGLYSLRRIDLSGNLFYPSATAAEAAMACSEAAIKANAEKQAGYKHGLRSLQTMASRLEQLPGALINFKPCGSPCRMPEPPLDLVSLLGDESRIIWSNSAGLTSLYDADSHSVMTLAPFGAPKGHGAIPISITRAAAADGSPVEQSHSFYVMGRMLPHNFRDSCFEELSYQGGQDVISVDELIRGWCYLPPPPIYELPDDIDAYTVFGGTIYVSSNRPGIGTFAFDKETCKWRRAGNWCLPFSGKAEYVPELKLWIGLSASRPFHLCASDLSAVDYDRPPTVHQTWVDLDMPKSWSPFQLDLISLGSGRFCVVKMFHSTIPVMGFSDEEDSDNDEALDCRDVILWDFAVSTGIELVAASPRKLRMLKHMSKYYAFEDYIIKRVL